MRSCALTPSGITPVAPKCIRYALTLTERLSNRIDIIGGSSQAPHRQQGGPSALETALNTKFSAIPGRLCCLPSQFVVLECQDCVDCFRTFLIHPLISSHLRYLRKHQTPSIRLTIPKNQSNHCSARSCRQFPYDWYLVFFLVQRTLFASAGSYPLPVQRRREFMEQQRKLGSTP